jgi:hypothetical protein
MTASASPSEPTPSYERAAALLELALHVNRLTDEGRLSQDDAAAVIQMLSAQAFAVPADGDD